MKVLVASLTGLAVWGGYMVLGSRASALVAQQKSPQIIGNGIVKTESRRLGADFRAIHLSGAIEGEIEESSNSPLKIVAEANILPHIRHDVVDGVLKVYTVGNLNYEKPIRIYVNAKRFDSFDVSGACQLVAKRVGNHPIKVNGSGAAKIEIQGTPNAVDALLSGAGVLKLGQVKLNFLRLDLSGASKFQAKGNAASASIKMSGASSVTGDLSIAKGSISASGAASVSVKSTGNSTKQVSGAASINGQ
jgi:hypothetical protein